MFLQPLLMAYGPEDPYRPLFNTLQYNLKRGIWKSVEVHAIYALVFHLCTNVEGVIHLDSYFSSGRIEVF